MYIRQLKQEVHDKPFDNNSYLANRIGFWATVTEVNSKLNSVSVASDTGFELEDIPVMSKEWINVDKTKQYVPAERNLPPVNSRVFVLTPTYSVAGAFVLCSGFSFGDENIRELWAKTESEKTEKDSKYEKITQGGWNFTEDYSNGDVTLTNKNNSNLKFTFTVKNSENNCEFNIQDPAGNQISITKDGITVTDANSNKIEETSNGIKVTDTNNNIYCMDNSGVKITGKNSETITMDSSGIELAKGSVKVTLSTTSVKLAGPTGTLEVS